MSYLPVSDALNCLIFDPISFDAQVLATRSQKDNAKGLRSAQTQRKQVGEKEWFHPLCSATGPGILYDCTSNNIIDSF